MIDGVDVGTAAAACGPWAVNLFGGSVISQARGRGVYRALTHARWSYAVERGTPALTIQADRMSKPVAERLGFTWLEPVRVYVEHRLARLKCGTEGCVVVRDPNLTRRDDNVAQSENAVHHEAVSRLKALQRGLGRRGTDGAGLGLAIVRSVAFLHGGTVELTGRTGGGLEMLVTVATHASGATSQN